MPNQQVFDATDMNWAADPTHRRCSLTTSRGRFCPPRKWRCKKLGVQNKNYHMSSSGSRTMSRQASASLAAPIAEPSWISEMDRLCSSVKNLPAESKGVMLITVGLHHHQGRNMTQTRLSCRDALNFRNSCPNEASSVQDHAVRVHVWPMHGADSSVTSASLHEAGIDGSSLHLFGECLQHGSPGLVSANFE